MMTDKVSVIIPAYKPDEKLLGVLRDLAEIGFSDILVVDDGSGEQYESVFQQVTQLPQCTLLRHPANRGKGAALKTAFAYFLENRPDHAGVITADADGQHLAKDIAAVGSAMVEQNKVILGVRDFTGPNVPTSNKMGNKITIAVFRLFFGMKIGDTQTGLRAFPRCYMADLAQAEGDRYEFETHMLFLMNRQNIPYGQVGISTVYIEENRSSHFNKVWDSIRIYALILKYLFSSVAATVIDEGVFFLVKLLFGTATLLWNIPTTFIAAFIARVISSLTNYTINAKVVFNGKTGAKTLIRYYILVVCQIAVSACAVFLIERLLSVTSPGLSTLIKTAVDLVLFFISFRVQHKWVFNNSTRRDH